MDIKSTAIAHHTDKYKLATSKSVAIRRGQTFDLIIDWSRLPTSACRNVTFRALVETTVGQPMEVAYPYLSGFPISGNSTRSVTYRFNLPADAPIGRYVIEATHPIFGTSSILTFPENSEDALYVLMNPWFPGDAVFLGANPQNAAEDYVLDTRSLFEQRIPGVVHEWQVGQFEPAALGAAMKLLDGMSLANRKVPASVGLALSAGTRAGTTSGRIALASWDPDEYESLSCWLSSDCRTPTSWSGSNAILKQYMDNPSEPVQYVQCWGLAQIQNTLFRAVGIPCRAVTCVKAAHDSDGDWWITRNESPAECPTAVPQFEMVWSFHAWTEAYMTRPDRSTFPQAGWQVFDPTYQLIAAPVAAVLSLHPATFGVPRSASTGGNYGVGAVVSAVDAPIRSFVSQPAGGPCSYTDNLTGVGTRITTYGTRTGSGPLGLIDRLTAYKPVLDVNDPVNVLEIPSQTQAASFSCTLRNLTAIERTFTVTEIVTAVRTDGVTLFELSRSSSQVHLFAGESFDFQINVGWPQATNIPTNLVRCDVQVIDPIDGYRAFGSDFSSIAVPVIQSGITGTTPVVQNVSNASLFTWFNGTHSICHDVKLILSGDSGCLFSNGTSREVINLPDINPGDTIQQVCSFMPAGVGSQTIHAQLVFDGYTRARGSLTFVTDSDCNGNATSDAQEIANGSSTDCNQNGIPDVCEPDRNHNGFPDDCDIAAGTSLDCDRNGVPDEVDVDCNGNGIVDVCERRTGLIMDCNHNGIPDSCDIVGGFSFDTNHNGTPDECESICYSLSQHHGELTAITPACATRQTSWARTFDLSTIPSPQNAPITLRGVKFAVGSGSMNSGCTVAVYIDEDGGAPTFPGVDLQPVASTLLSSCGPDGSIRFVQFTRGVTVPAASHIVIEIQRTNSNLFSVGANNQAQDGSTYLRASNCAYELFVDSANSAYGAFSAGIWLELSTGFTHPSRDFNGNGIPDACERDCPGDFNLDRVVDFFDYLDFVQAFGSSNPLADFNVDGTIDFFDYLDFVQAFSAGC